ncbi:MAG: hypothetical protein WC708_05355 [Lentisphaeria bacterium]
MKHLSSILSQAGHSPVPVNFPDGSRLLLLPAGGRMLGLFPAGTEDNFLWTNPALAAAESARAYFARGGWPNPGGDRTWLAPEIELFIGDLKRAGDTYAVPPALDPGAWQVAAADSARATLTTTARLSLLQSRRTIEARLEKAYRPAANPLPALAGLDYAGYTQRTTLELEPAADTATPVRLGIWNLLQLPPPGEMLIPAWSATPPQVVFGTPAAGELETTARLVRWHMGGPGGDAKIALKALPLAGRAGHLSRGAGDGQWNLVVRQFAVEPAGDYVDALWTDPAATGWVFQACCVRSGAERFNELEYHAPAAGTEPGRNRVADESQVWAFRGPAAAVAEAARLLLGAELKLG